MRWPKLGVVLLALTLPGAVHAQQFQQIAGIYTDMRYVAEAGDLLGIEIFIVPSEGAQQYVAFVQEAEGVPTEPVVVPVIQKNGRISIAAKFNGANWKFDGTITKMAFDGTLTIDAGKPERIHLRRKKSYWE